MSSGDYSYKKVKNIMLSMPRFQDVGARAARFGIDQIKEFCDAIGNPQNSYTTIHVAGTNGKGTVCSLIASMITELGFKTGLYTSPHLNNVRERFRINGQMISEKRMVQCYEEFEQVMKLHPLTFFELTTAMAFRMFEMEKVDVAIIETGLGGRLDATNIIRPAVCVITSIGLDHTEQLGPTLESIAFEKAGILKPHIPFILGELPKEAKNTIMEHASSVRAQELPFDIDVLQNPDGTFNITHRGKSVHAKCDLNTPMLETNIRMAVKAVLCIVKPDESALQALARGLSGVRMNSGLIGRFEKIHPTEDWYFDGGHNTQALSTITAHLDALYPHRKKNVVVSLMSDKVNPEVIELLSRFDQIFYFELNAPRALKSVDFLELIPSAEVISTDTEEVKKKLCNLKSELVLFTGSFYFYTTVSEWMESLSLDSN
jgi:dihydrofolate synthase / folylpolyglutamate synthase